MREFELDATYESTNGKDFRKIYHLTVDGVTKSFPQSSIRKGDSIQSLIDRYFPKLKSEDSKRPKASVLRRVLAFLRWLLDSKAEPEDPCKSPQADAGQRKPPCS